MTQSIIKSTLRGESMTKPTKKEILIALAEMWEQYCPQPYGHSFMGAGEDTENILLAYGLLKKDGNVDWPKLGEPL